MKNSSSPVVAGVLSIVSGVFGILWGITLVLFAVLMMNIDSFPATTTHDFPFDILQVVCLVWGTILLILAIVAIIGGIYSFQRKMWGLALTGAIVAMLVFLPTGIAAVIFVGLSRQEFR